MARSNIVSLSLGLALLCSTAYTLFPWQTQDLSSLRPLQQSDITPFTFETKPLAQEPYVSPEHISYILRVRFPLSLKKTPALCGYYKGYNLEFDTDYCIIQENRSCDQFTIAITEQIKRKVGEKNLHYLERIAGPKKCRLFYIRRNHENDSSNPWIVEEEEEKNVPIKLPPTAIVLFLDPKHVDSLTCDKGNFKEAGFRGPVVNLPYITIKSSIPAKELEKTSVTALLASLDSRAVHSPIPKEIKIERTTIISMRTPTEHKAQS